MPPTENAWNKNRSSPSGCLMAVIFSITVLAVMGVSSITPAFPVVREALGLTTNEVGLLITVFTLPGVILTPVYGILIDRVSRRKVIVPVLLIYGIAGIMPVVTRDFGLILLFRFVQGVGNAPLTTLSLTLITDTFRGERRDTIMGYNAGLLSIATALFPAIGGGLAALSWQAPFFLSLLAIIVGGGAFFLVPGGRDAAQTGVREYLRQAIRGLGNRYIMTLYLCAFMVFCILFGPFLTYMTFFLSERFGLRPVGIGLSITFMSLSTAVVSFNLGRLLKRFSFFTCIITALVLYGVSTAVIPFIFRLHLVYIPVFLFGLAQGLAVPSIQILVSRYAPPAQKAVFLSFYSVVMNGGAALGPVLAGLAFGYFGYPGCFGMGAVLAVLGIVLFIAFAGKTLYNQTRI